MEITVFEALTLTFAYSVFIAILATVFTAQYHSTGVFNVAFSGYAVIGGVLAYAMERRFFVYYYYALPFCIIIGVIIGLLQWKHINFLKNRKLKPELVLLSCFGVLIVLEGLAYTLSYLLRPVSYIDFYFPNKFEIFIQNIPLIRIIAIISLILAAFIINNIEKKGTLYKAIGENTELAQIQGIDTSRINQRLWIISGVILCTTGCFIEISRNININSYLFVLTPLVLAGAFIGGVRSLRMAFIGGFSVSMLEFWMVYALQPIFPSAGEYGSLIPISVLCLAFLLRSQKSISESS